MGEPKNMDESERAIAHAALAIEVVRVAGIADAITSMMRAHITALTQSEDLPPPARLLKALDDASPELEMQIAEVFAEHATDAELRHAASYHQTELAQSYRRNIEAAQPQLNRIGEQWMTEILVRHSDALGGDHDG